MNNNLHTIQSTISTAKGKCRQSPGSVVIMDEKGEKYWEDTVSAKVSQNRLRHIFNYVVTLFTSKTEFLLSSSVYIFMRQQKNSQYVFGVSGKTDWQGHFTVSNEQPTEKSSFLGWQA